MKCLFDLQVFSDRDSYFTIGSSYRISKTAVSRIVPETCKALWDVLQPEMLPQPDQITRKKIASDFDRLWQFSHCVGALDGKHITTQAPNKTGSFFNYKKIFQYCINGRLRCQLQICISGYWRLWKPERQTDF